MLTITSSLVSQGSEISTSRRESLNPASEASTQSSPEKPDAQPASDEPVSKPFLHRRNTTSELEELDTMDAIPDAMPESSTSSLQVPTAVSHSSHDSCSDDEAVPNSKHSTRNTCPHFLLTAEEHSIYSTLWIPGVVTREAMQQVEPSSST